MSPHPDQPSREQQDYLQEFLQLKIDACYIRDYRNGFNRWVTTAATIRAIAASGSIAVWAVWQKHAIIWASIVAASQLADALKDVFPFAKRRKALSAWVRQLDRLFVFAQRDWADKPPAVAPTNKSANNFTLSAPASRSSKRSTSPRVSSTTNLSSKEPRQRPSNTSILAIIAMY